MMLLLYDEKVVLYDEKLIVNHENLLLDTLQTKEHQINSEILNLM